MKYLLVLIVGLFFTYWSLYTVNDPGTVMLSFQGNVYTVSFRQFCLLMATAVCGFSILFWILALIAYRKKKRRIISQLVRERKTRSSLAKGLIALASDNWAQAEKILMRRAHRSTAQLACYLGSASAAHQMGDKIHRNKFLEKARAVTTTGDTTELVAAQFLVRDEDYAAARDKLESLNQSDPNVQKLLVGTYVKLAHWEKLLALLPNCKRSGVLNTDDVWALELKCHAGRLEQAAREHGITGLLGIWETLEKTLQKHPRLLETLTRNLLAHGEESAALTLLRKALQGNWDDALFRLYLAVEKEPNLEKLALAEKLSAARPNDPEILRHLAALNYAGGRWHVAERYLERSIEIEPHPEAYRLLAETLEQLGDRQRAQQMYRQGLQLITQDPPPLGTGISRPPTTETEIRLVQPCESVRE